MIQIPFQHKMAAHCESGTVTALLNHAGLKITEPITFGLSSGIFFAYFHKHPSFSFPTFVVRVKPGQIRKNIEKRLGVKFYTKRFRNTLNGEQALDSLIEKNIPAAVQVDFYYMDYVPNYLRTHINVHFITVIGMNQTKYLVSDMYQPEIAELEKTSMRKARFAEGIMAPKGFIFYPTSIPQNINYEKAIKRAIKKAAFNMVKLPIPILGVSGIRLFAKKVLEWPKLARDVEHLSNEIMKINLLLEDQGTGGAGFRFIYATFLRQASEILNNQDLLSMSKRMMVIGDGWRDISLFVARIGKNRDLGENKMKELSDMLMDRADAENIFFTDLLKIIK